MDIRWCICGDSVYAKRGMGVDKKWLHLLSKPHSIRVSKSQKKTSAQIPGQAQHSTLQTLFFYI